MHQMDVPSSEQGTSPLSIVPRLVVLVKWLPVLDFTGQSGLDRIVKIELR
jgi:hypothetical protein